MLNQSVLAALPDGTAAKDYVLFVAGNIFIVVLVFRTLMHYMKREWGAMFGHIGAGIIVGAIIYTTDAFIGILKGIWGLVSGTS